MENAILNELFEEDMKRNVIDITVYEIVEGDCFNLAVYITLNDLFFKDISNIIIAYNTKMYYIVKLYTAH